MPDLLEQATGVSTNVDDGLPRGDEDSQLNTLVDWLEEYNTSTAEARRLSERDRDFYDGKQWSAEERKRLSQRGQPEVVMNRIFTRVNDTLGAESENMTDPRAYPRTFNMHNDESEAATDALRAWNDMTKFDDCALQVLEDLAIEGAGGAVFELDVEPDPEMHSQGKDGNRNVVDIRYVPWDRLFWDPHSREPDFSDAMFKGITTWLHLSEAQSRWPDKKDLLENVRYQHGTGDNDFTHDDKPLWYHSGLQRVAVREIWYRELVDGVYEWKYAVFTREGFLETPTKVEWEDDSGRTICPLLITSGFITRENLMRYGMVRNMISPQEEVNKRRSKALYHFVADRVLYEASAVEEPQRMKQELAKPDGAVKLNEGALQDGRFQIVSQVDRGQAHLALQAEAKAEIDELGPHANLPAGVPQDLSARSFFAQQQAGMRKIGPLFAHYRAWKLAVYRFAWFGIRRYWPEARWLRVRDKADSMGYRFVRINEKTTRGERALQLIQRGDAPIEAVASAYGPEGVKRYEELVAERRQAEQLVAEATGEEPDKAAFDQEMINRMLAMPISKEEFTINDVSRLDVDIIIDVTPSSTILEHEQFTMLAEMRRHDPNAIPMSVLIKTGMFHNKKELLEELQPAPDPQAQAIQQQQLQLQMAQMQAQIEKASAEAASANAKAQQLMADAQKKIQEAKEMVPAEAARDLAQAEKLKAEAPLMIAEAERATAEARAKPVDSTAKLISASRSRGRDNAD